MAAWPCSISYSKSVTCHFCSIMSCSHVDSTLVHKAGISMWINTRNLSHLLNESITISDDGSLSTACLYSTGLSISLCNSEILFSSVYETITVFYKHQPYRDSHEPWLSLSEPNQLNRTYVLRRIQV